MTPPILYVSNSDVSESSADDVNDEKDRNSDLDIYWEEAVDNNDNQTQTSSQYQEFHGPKHTLPSNSTPLTYFYVFLTTTFLNSTVTETNIRTGISSHPYKSFSMYERK